MVTVEQNAANLRSAENVAAAALGVDRFNLTYEQRVAYVRKLAETILQYPERFRSETLAAASAVVGKNYSPFEDASFDWTQFASEAGGNFVETGAAVAGVGEGVKTTLQAARWAIPAAAVLGVAYVGFRLLR